VASLSQGRTAAAQCGLFTHKSVPVIFEPPCTITLSQAPALTVLHGLPDPEDGDTTVLTDVSKHLSGSTVSHLRSKKVFLFSAHLQIATKYRNC